MPVKLFAATHLTVVLVAIAAPIRTSFVLAHDYDKPREQFTVQHNLYTGRPGREYSFGHYPCWLSGPIKQNDKGVWQARSFHIKANQSDFGPVYYPALADGDVVAMFGFLYRVRIVNPEKFAGTHTIGFRYVGDDFAGGKYKLRPDSVPVPVASDFTNNTSMYLSYNFRVDGIAPDAGGRGTSLRSFWTGRARKNRRSKSASGMSL